MDGKEVDQEAFAVAIIAECIVALSGIPDGNIGLSEVPDAIVSEVNEYAAKIHKHFGFK